MNLSRAAARFAVVAASLLVCNAARAQDSSVSWGRKDPATSQPGPRRGWKAYLLDVRELRRAIRKELDLSEEQNEQIRQILKDYEEQQKQMLRKVREVHESQALQDLRREMEQARQARDYEKIRELMAKRKQLMGQFHPFAARQELLESIRRVLTDEQKAKFRRILERLAPRRARPDRPDPRHHPRLLRQALEKISLDDAQRTEIEALFHRFAEERKTLGRVDPKTQRAKSEQLYQDVVNLLSDEQKQALERSVAELQPPPRAARQWRIKRGGSQPAGETLQETTP